MSDVSAHRFAAAGANGPGGPHRPASWFPTEFELRRRQRVMLGREGRILALKAEVDALPVGSGQQPRHAAAAESAVESHG